MSSKSKSKASNAIESSSTIEEATQAFIASGGKITQIKSGVSGMVNHSGPRHISLSKTTK